MWFLGAGASVSAGLPTAMDMIWEFKRALYISRSRSPGETWTDLSQPAVRNRIDAHIESMGGMPSPGAPDEYAALFEAAYPAEQDRREFLDAKMRGATPSYGHMALATLMRQQLTRIVWTTNFDALVADACAKVYDTTSELTTVTLDTVDLARNAITEERWPVEVKLHGDFRSRRLKNTDDELRHQDAKLREMLVDSCRRFGLVVAGYSGRDDSVMDALEEAMKDSNAFPSGLFWLHRGDYPPLPRVTRLLARGDKSDIEVALVPIENFDETLRDLIRLAEGIDTTVLDEFAQKRQRASPAQFPQGRHRGWPVVRLNALPIVDAPTQCRRLVCNIGGTAEVREAVEKAGVDALAVRSRVGVLAFGADVDLRSAFGSYGITEFDLHALDVNRRRYQSTERGLLADALVRALSRNCGLNVANHRNLAPANPEDPTWEPLRQLVGTLSGVARGHPNLEWWEGIGVRLDWADDRLWLLVEPRTVFDGITDANKMAAADFARERTIRRYNRKLDDLIDFWAHHLTRDENHLRALNVGDGVDALFRLESVTAFSRRIMP